MQHAHPRLSAAPIPAWPLALPLPARIYVHFLNLKDYFQVVLNITESFEEAIDW